MSAPPPWLRTGPGNVLLDVLVSPRASREKLGPVNADRLKVYLTAPPVDGAANQALIELLSDVLDVARTSLTLVAGLSSRRKIVAISALEWNDVCARLRRAGAPLPDDLAAPASPPTLR